MTDWTAQDRSPPILLAYPFRIFFLLCGGYPVLVVLAWIAFLFGGWPLPLGWAPLQWHSHEMLYGFVTAAVAGFVLTAMSNWTGARPLQGGALLALALLWVAGRAAMWMAGWLPGWLVAAVELVFLPVLGLYVAGVLIRHRNYRNLMLVAIIGLLFAGNLMMHIGFVTGKTGLLQLGQLHGLDVITALIVVIAGRITPAFTGNWLRREGGDPARVKTWPWIEYASLGSIIALLISNWLQAADGVAGVLAIVAGVSNALRLSGWSGWQARREPLLWILHFAYLWVVIALLLRGASTLGAGVAPSLWQHALGLGGIATLILGVMTRVTVGHTGRPLQLLRFGIVIYLAIIAATLLRLLAATALLDYRIGVTLAALSWVLAFGLFTAVYGPVLASPRVDGRPG
ncbi:NnrS family protein [Proteobacteria bacterium 005FR1]|nr:NnrS family protein [Proteobacteria bacterium 005FR1]